MKDLSGGIVLSTRSASSLIGQALEERAKRISGIRQNDFDKRREKGRFIVMVVQYTKKDKKDKEDKQYKTKNTKKTT
jgi:hypothetical protein